MAERPTVIYDDHCPECTVGKNLAERLDTKKQIDFVGMHTERGRQIVHKHGLDVRSSAYIIQNGAISGKAKMIRDVLAHNGVIGFLLSLPFRTPWFGDRLYELIARHRDHRMHD